MSAGESRLTPAWAKARAFAPSAKFVALSHLRRLRGCEQVAAVCYRVRGAAIEFLLVQTRGGRWTFPKGSAEPGLTHAQAAALEAYEEAGVHGRMEEASFARYTRRKRGGLRESASVELGVNAHLCEVLWLGPPQEADRNPTWFSPEKAKRRLREDRASGDGTELARVVDRAVARIHRVRRALSAGDALQKVQFTIEAPIRSGKRPAIRRKR
jgi:8-oxo-dGTP pyrophosphatase MutT (NUDIX family)